METVALVVGAVEPVDDGAAGVVAVEDDVLEEPPQPASVTAKTPMETQSAGMPRVIRDHVPALDGVQTDTAIGERDRGKPNVAQPSLGSRVSTCA